MLNRGGGAELIDTDTEETVWASDEDEEFLEEFPHFLEQSDVFDILNYLEEIGEMSRGEADRCEVKEEFYRPSDVAGMF